jgi:tetratricopeptide (TPR) repeat protein
MSPEATTALWSKEYKTTFNELPNVSQMICIDITEGLRVDLSEADRKRLSKKVAVDSLAYESFLKGRSCRYAGDLAKGLDCFQDALNREAQFARAHAASAEVYILMAYTGKTSFNEAIEKAKEGALRALTIDPTLMEAFTVLAFVSMCYEWSWPEVAPLFTKAFATNPINPKSEERLRTVLQQIKSSLTDADLEQSTIPYFLRAYTLIHVGKFEEALEAASDAVERDANSFMAHRALGLSHLGMENYDEAIKSLEEAAALSNRHPWLLFELMGAYTQAGRREEALAIMDETMAHSNILPARIHNFLFP